MENNNVARVIVQNKDGEIISTTWANRALKLVSRNKAEVVSEEPLAIRLLEQVEVDINE